MADVHFIPAEIAHHCLSPQGVGEVAKAYMAGAVIKPLVMIRKLRGAWVARFEFEAPIGPQNAREHALQLTLVIRPAGRV